MYANENNAELLIKEFSLDQMFVNNIDDLFASSIFPDEVFMYSIYPLYNSPRAQKNLETKGIHSRVKHSGALMLDSGGFQFMNNERKMKAAKTKLKELRKGQNKDLSTFCSRTKDLGIPSITKSKIEIERNKIEILNKKLKTLTTDELIEIYKKCNLQDDDFCISLDFPPWGYTAYEEAMRMIKQNNDNYLYIRENLPSGLQNNLVHVIHGWELDAITSSMSVIDEQKLVAIGGFFPTMITGRYLELANKFKIIIDLIHQKQFSNIRFHGLGANGQNPFHICAFAGIEQTDSASWRHNALNMKLIFAELPAASISKRHNDSIKSKIRVNFKAPWRETHDIALKGCECPVCRGLNIQERKDLLSKNAADDGKGFGKIGFETRCIHNIFQFIKEKEIAQDLVNDIPKYTRYLEKRFENNPRDRHLFNSIRPSTNECNLDQFFRTI